MRKAVRSRAFDFEEALMRRDHLQKATRSTLPGTRSPQNSPYIRPLVILAEVGHECLKKEMIHVKESDTTENNCISCNKNEK